MEKVSLIRFSLVPLKNNPRDSVILGKTIAWRYNDSVTENQLGRWKQRGSQDTVVKSVSTWSNNEKTIVIVWGAKICHSERKRHVHHSRSSHFSRNLKLFSDLIYVIDNNEAFQIQQKPRLMTQPLKHLMMKSEWSMERTVLEERVKADLVLFEQIL